MRKKKGFTLIELISVLVILAIVALIVTPIVLNIIKKARTAADKRSIDAYGRSIELAIADYLLDKGDFPTSIEQLTIEYSGAQVVCSTTQLKDDGTVYLAECTVGGREITGYTYGKGGEEESETPAYTAYIVGDQVTYNNVDYYVIEDSDASESTVKLLKATPLTVNEVNQYGSGHVNMNIPSDDSSYQQAYDNNGYGGMQYYSNATCGAHDRGIYNQPLYINEGCTTDYAQSEVKYVVDAWKTAEAPAASEARLITVEEVLNLGYEWGQTCPTCDNEWIKTENVPTWLYNSNYYYWTMSQYNDSASDVWNVYGSGGLGNNNVNSYSGAVRPVIVLSKSALSA